MIRVLIVDDQAVIRAGVARILSGLDGFDVVGECTDGDEAAAAMDDLHPDLVLMDVRMHRIDGITATRLLRTRPDAPAVLILTTFDDDSVLWGALEAGAGGFILKDAPAEDLLAAARAVAGGAAWLDPKVAPRLLTSLRSSARSEINANHKAEQLTDREHDVLRHMARGATNTEIAKALLVSQATVKSHIGAIFVKLGARDRAAAIVFAFDRGIVHPQPTPAPGT